MAKIKTVARVQVTIELLIPGNWSQETTAEQIYKQAKDSATEQLRKIRGIAVVGDLHGIIVMSQET